MSSPDGGTFYRYVDPSGAVSYTDDPAKIPPGARERAEPLALPARPDEGPTPVLEEPAPPAGARAEAWLAREVPALHLPSFGLGVGATLVALLVARVLGSRAKLALKATAVLAAAALAAGAYLGYLRKSAGLHAGALASPKDLVDDAEEAAAKAKARQDALKALER